MPGVWATRLLASLGRVPAWHWVVMLVVGILAGTYVAILPTLVVPREIQSAFDFSSRSWTFLFILAGMAPFLGLIAAGIFKNPRKLLLVAILMEMPIQIDYRFGYSEFEQRFGTISGFTFSVTTICLILLYAWWLVDILGKWRSAPDRSFYRTVMPAVLYVVVVACSFIFAINVMATFNWTGLLLQAFLLFIYVAYFVRTQEDLQFIATVMLIGLIFNSLLIIGFGAAGVGGEEQAAAVSQSNVDVQRAGGPLKVPNLTGSYLAMTMVSMFSFFGMPRKWWHTVLAAIAIGFGGLAILWTGSRGAWLSFGVGVSLLALLLIYRRWLSLKVPLTYVFIALCFVIAFYEPLIERLFGDAADAAAESRGPLNIIAIRMIRDHPVFGVGANNFASNLGDYVTSEFTGEWIRTVHNHYLLVWAETGIIGFVLYFGFLLITIYRGWTVWRAGDRALAPLALGFTLAIVAALVHMTGEKYHSRIQTELVWLNAGLVTAAFRMHLNPQPHTESLLRTHFPPD